MVLPPTSVDELFELLRRTGGDGDANVDGRAFDADQVDELSHGLQCAADLADHDPTDLELQVAGLVHDLGHLAVPDDPDAHGRAGADLVRPLLGDRVASLVELHVPAKRYLVTTDPAYRSGLSAGSVYTLELQGGTLSPSELAEFEAQPGAPDALTLRRADEAAKDPTRSVAPLEHWRSVVDGISR